LSVHDEFFFFTKFDICVFIRVYSDISIMSIPDDGFFRNVLSCPLNLISTFLLEYILIFNTWILD